MKSSRKAPRLLHVHVTLLEMRNVPAKRESSPSGQRIALMRAIEMTPAFYRFLYREVGKPHHWFLRRDLNDEALSAEISPGKAEIFVLYVEGCPAGFIELDITEKPETVQIHYFGLIPHFQGRGLGKFFLSEAIFAAWAHKPRRVLVETNSLDSPRAIILYQKMGFGPIHTREENVPAWD